MPSFHVPLALNASAPPVHVSPDDARGSSSQRSRVQVSRVQSLPGARGHHRDQGGRVKPREQAPHWSQSLARVSSPRPVMGEACNAWSTISFGSSLSPSGVVGLPQSPPRSPHPGLSCGLHNTHRSQLRIIRRAAFNPASTPVPDGGGSVQLFPTHLAGSFIRDVVKL